MHDADWGVSSKLRKLLRVEGGGHDDNFKLWQSSNTFIVITTTSRRRNNRIAILVFVAIWVVLI